MDKTRIEQGINGSTNLPRTGYGPYDTPTCAICGCTSDVPCFDGEQVCYWVTMDSETNAGTCSECLGF
jgi:hypothetical protein